MYYETLNHNFEKTGAELLKKKAGKRYLTGGKEIPIKLSRLLNETL